MLCLVPFAVEESREKVGRTTSVGAGGEVKPCGIPAAGAVGWHITALLGQVFQFHRLYSKAHFLPQKWHVESAWGQTSRSQPPARTLSEPCTYPE